jgi:hypothetical protein
MHTGPTNFTFIKFLKASMLFYIFLAHLFKVRNFKDQESVGLGMRAQCKAPAMLPSDVNSPQAPFKVLTGRKALVKILDRCEILLAKERRHLPQKSRPLLWQKSH